VLSKVQSYEQSASPLACWLSANPPTACMREEPQMNDKNNHNKNNHNKVIATAIVLGGLAIANNIPTANASPDKQSPQFPLYCSDEAPYPPPFAMWDAVCTIYGHGVQGQWASPPRQQPQIPTGPGSAACSSYHPSAYCGSTYNPFS